MLNHKGTQQIETNRLILRQFHLSDAEAVYNNWTGDDEVTKYLRLQTHKSPKETQTILYEWIKSYECNTSYRWGIILKQTGELIGSISASVQSEADSIADTGYCIGSRFRNHGYMTEALTAVLRYLILAVGFNRVEACHSVNNPASGRVMQKAGMTFEGILRQGYHCRLGYQDSCIYSMIRDDLLQAPAMAAEPGQK